MKLRIRKKLTGRQVAKEWKKLQDARLKRMKILYRTFKKDLKAFSIGEKELDERAKEFMDQIKPDLEELRWMAVIDFIAEERTR